MPATQGERPVPPQDLEAEASVLGAILIDPAVMVRVDELLDPEDFFRENNGQIYRAQQALWHEGEPIDNVSLAAELEKMGVLERVGGRAHLAMLQEQTPTAGNVEHYAKIVQQLAYKRREMDAAAEQYKAAANPLITADELAQIVGTRHDAAAELGRRWQQPIPLSKQYDRPPFPVEHLPNWLTEHAVAVSDAIQVPLDFPAVMGLAMLAVCAGGRVELQAKERYVEPLNLYTLVTARSGERKSAVFREMFGPLVEFEEALREERRLDTAEAAALRKVAEKTLERAQTAAAQAAGNERQQRMQEVATAAREAESIRVPPDFQLIADDSTPESLATLLADQGGRIALLSPEGGVFGQMAGRYSPNGEPNLDVYLKGHSGDLLRINRRGRFESVPRPALTIGIAVQPGVIRSLARHEEFDDRGVIARFLYALPTSRVGYRDPDAPPIPAAAADQYASQVKTLAWTLHRIDNPPHRLRLDPEAAQMRSAFEAAIEPRLREDGGDLFHIEKWASKLTGAVVRIAGLLHLAMHVREGWVSPVGVDAFEPATQIGRYFLGHALATFDLMGADPVLEQARRALDWMVKQERPWFTQRDAFEALKGKSIPGVKELAPVLALLESHGFIRRRPDARERRRGRPRSPVFDVNPMSAVVAASMSTDIARTIADAGGEDPGAESDGAAREAVNNDWGEIT